MTKTEQSSAAKAKAQQEQCHAVAEVVLGRDDVVADPYVRSSNLKAVMVESVS